MSLRARIFVLFGAVITLLLGAEWWLVSALRGELRAETAQTSLEVASSVLRELEHERPAVATAPVRGVPMLRLTPAIPNEAPALRLDVVPALPLVPASRAASLAMPLTPARSIRIPTQRLDALAGQFQTRVLLGSLAVLGLGLAAAAFLAQRVTAPLRDLAGAAEAVGAGRLGVQARLVGEKSLDATIAAFNAMSARLEELDAAARDAQARAHLTEIGEIARGIAHSLRNPLHVVGLTFSAISTARPDDQELELLLETARLQVAAIDRTLRLFLTMTAGSLGTASTVDLLEVARDVALEAAQAAGPGIAIDLRAEGLAPALLGVPAEVRAALHVLVVNAVEASRPGDTVRISVGSEGGAARCVVEDQGPGVPAEVRARLFQAHVTTKEQGAGFGLFLAERIATRRYRGSLVLEDREPSGTRATLVLRSLAGAGHG